MSGDVRISDEIRERLQNPPPIPADFETDKEHPVVPIPFSVRIGAHRLEGAGISITAADAKVPLEPDPSEYGRVYLATIQFPFEGFTIEITPEVRIMKGKAPGEVRLAFADPLGPHLPQLRYIINSFIAGDFVTLGSMLAYTGPVKPKSPKEKAQERGRNYVRSAGIVVASLLLIAIALNILLDRFLNAYEPRPVFITRAGMEMRATSPGQITYLDPEAGKGEIVYAIAANTGDVLNFQLPCDCEVVVNDGIFEGATVLPSDPILTFFDSNFAVRVQTQMSVEGLAKSVRGEQAYLDLADGRSIPVEVVETSATAESAQQGDLYLPVRLVPPEGALGPKDIGMPARLRLHRSLRQALGMGWETRDTDEK